MLHVPHLFKTPRFAPCPYVVTVHDVLDFLHRTPNQPPWKRALRFELAKRALKGAAGVLAVSNSTKDDVQRIFDLGDDYGEHLHRGVMREGIPLEHERAEPLAQRRARGHAD